MIMRFRDRQQAGEELAKALSKYRGKPVVVYALPRGGVVLGRVVAASLDAPFDLLIPRKIGAHGNEEYAIAAVTETGDVVKNEAEVVQVDPTWFAKVVQTQRQEAKRRRERYLSGRPRAKIKGKVAIIVDDGLATGLTMKAALVEVKVRQPQSIVVAVPVASPEAVQALEPLIDQLVVLENPSLFLGSVGSHYDSFDQVTDVEVMKLLSERRL